MKMNYSMNYKNTNMFNLVRIIFKFRNENSFGRLVGYFLALINVCLKDSRTSNQVDASEDSSDVYETYLSNQSNEMQFSYDKDYVYLWLNLVKKHMDSFSFETESSEVLKFEQNMFLDFVYICLYNLTNMKQRNLIKFQMGIYSNCVESQNKQNTMGFNNLLVFICLKTWLILHQSFDSTQMKIINAFVSDYVFNSSLIAVDSKINGPIEPKVSFHKYLTNELLLKGCSNEISFKSTIETMNMQLNEKLSECKTLASSNEKIKLANGTKFRINTLSQAFMHKFEQSLNLKTLALDNNHSIQVSSLNLVLRVRHLLYLLSILKKEVFFLNNFLNSSRIYQTTIG
jgi:hypothetical protein